MTFSFPYMNRTSTSFVTPTALTALYPNPTCSGPKPYLRNAPTWYPAPRVHDIYIQLCPGDTVKARPPSVLLSRHALVPGVFQWSSSVRRSRVRPGHLQRPSRFTFFNLGLRKALAELLTESQILRLIMAPLMKESKAMPRGSERWHESRIQNHVMLEDCLKANLAFFLA
ncbi:hypothetical protein QVD17_38243 [Tagetes erecta]|uniref:Uncharacterized protein n=1 Tax=Tagetes erecta TaxID=13708 RepID=A0AAD8JXJ9_TARER|nr:hypothetical protein QVD17_38243 [Tagetes erecta]